MSFRQTFEEKIKAFENNEHLSEVLKPYRQQVALAARQFAMGAIGLFATVFFGVCLFGAPGVVIFPPLIASACTMVAGGILSASWMKIYDPKKYAPSPVTSSLFSFHDKLKDITAGKNPEAPLLINLIQRSFR